MTTPQRLLLIDDDADLLQLLSLRLTANGYRVTAVSSAEAAQAQMAIDLPALVISDIRMPGKSGLRLLDDIRMQYPSLPVILLTAHGTIPDAVEATAHGAFSYLTKPYDAEVLLDTIAQALHLTAGAAGNGCEVWCEGVISRSPRMAQVVSEARHVAMSEVSVSIRGERGTGKELLARAIHQASRRAGAPFIAVDCSAISAQLLESELFGYVKGAFDGAAAHCRGLIQAADGGTLFLDEIGHIPVPLQLKLLRFLQERAVRPAGATETIPVDVRIMSATHRDLDKAVADGEFREDLYYRLNVVALTVPALAERREDIGLLATCFLQTIAVRDKKQLNGFAPEALAMLTTAPWPGNVRQLYNVVEQVCALTSTALISASLVQRTLHMPAREVLPYADAKQRFERAYLIQLLQLTDGKVMDAARLADRNRTEFYRLLQKNGLDPTLFRGGDAGATTVRQK